MADDVTRDPETGRLTIKKAGTYRITVPLVNADWTAGETATPETVAAFYADLAAKRSGPDPLHNRIAELEAALRALVEPEPVKYEGRYDAPALCAYCSGALAGDVPHEPDCPVVVARALLKGAGDG
jgi:hypothetical protein